MRYETDRALVLALSPNARGFAFVLFESALAPYDWGVREVRRSVKHQSIVAFVRDMIERYAPLVLVLEDWSDQAFRRGDRTLALYLALVELACEKSVQLVRIGKAELKQHFVAVIPSTKYEIALAIAKQISALSFQVPPFRKIWMSEDPRQGLYDAAALGLTYLARSDHDVLPAVGWG